MGLWLDMDGLDPWRIWAICFAWKFGKLCSKHHPSFEQTNTLSLFIFLDVFGCFWFHSLILNKTESNAYRRRVFFCLSISKKRLCMKPTTCELLFEGIFTYLLPWSSWTKATSITGVTKALLKENQMPGRWVFPIHFSPKWIIFLKNPHKIWMKPPPKTCRKGWFSITSLIFGVK